MTVNSSASVETSSQTRWDTMLAKAKIAPRAVGQFYGTTLTAVTSVVKNTEAPEGQQRVYRMKMTLDHNDSRWLVSNVEFVA